MAKSKEIVVRINGDADKLLKEFRKIRSETETLEAGLNNVAKKSAATFAAITIAAGGAIKVFADFEEGLIGVGKTADLSGKELQDFGKEIQALSRRLPFATKELLGIAQSAGQLGVKGRDNIIKFTTTIAKLGTASDLSGEEAATALTRILNVTGESITTIDKFASVIVALGNNFAATESEIARMTTEVSRSISVFGVSAAEAAALGTALRSVGIQAEGGGSAVGRAFRAIDASIREGGASMRTLTKITGLTGDQLKKTFEQDSTKVFQLFTEGLGRAIASGASATDVLEQFGLKGDEILKVLPVLATNSELLGDALAIAAKETENATALNTEFEKAITSTNSKTKLLVNTFKNVVQEVGVRLAPAFNNLVDSTRELLERFINLDSKTKDTIVTVGKYVTGLIGLTAVVATAGAALLKLRAAFIAVGIAAKGAWASATLGLSLIVVGIIELVDQAGGLGRVLSGVQASFELFGRVTDRIINNAKIAVNDLIISYKNLKIAVLDALPGNAAADAAARLRFEINLIKQESASLAQQNADTAKTFGQIFDEIEAEKAREKVRQAGEAEKEQRAINFEEELTQRQEQEDARLAQEQEWRDNRSELDAEIRELQLQIKDEENLLDREKLKLQLDELQKLRDKSLTEEQKRDKKAKANLLKELGLYVDQSKTWEQNLADFKAQKAKETFDTFVSSAKGIVKEGTAAAKALFLAEQAAKFAENIVQTQAAMAKAAAATAPFSAPFVAFEAAQGALRGAAIAGATISGFSGAKDGALVGDGLQAPGGDRFPYMLEKGELVVPKRNFNEVVSSVAASRGAGGNQMKIMLELNEDAAQFITARQFENTTLGTDRG